MGLPRKEEIIGTIICTTVAGPIGWYFLSPIVLLPLLAGWYLWLFGRDGIVGLALMSLSMGVGALVWHFVSGGQ